ncbi:hypothetical protein [Ruegeria halocynthiae]|uniref:hypothetical protein n=1 Tax=Ruegeria halocynthiae TaxID=985054 RepID=UPI00056CF5F3|nr:hypothetical protein [Ruegeria halocynthiae]
MHPLANFNQHESNKMNVNFIVSFNSREQILFDIDVATKDVDYEQMKLQLQLAAFLCLQINNFNVDDVWKISTAANWNDTWCKEHGPLPSNFKTHFNGKFAYGIFRNDNKSLRQVLQAHFQVSKMCRFDYFGKPYSVAEYYARSA